MPTDGRRRRGSQVAAQRKHRAIGIAARRCETREASRTTEHGRLTPLRGCLIFCGTPLASAVAGALPRIRPPAAAPPPSSERRRVEPPSIAL
eukprot:1850078-Prymnesium_polylepis.1